MFSVCDKKDFENFLILSMIVSFALTLLSRGSSLWLDLRTPDTKQFSVDKQCSLITSVSNFCYHHQNLLQFTKIITRVVLVYESLDWFMTSNWSYFEFSRHILQQYLLCLNVSVIIQFQISEMSKTLQQSETVLITLRMNKCRRVHLKKIKKSLKINDTLLSSKIEFTRKFSNTANCCGDTQFTS